ncbi:acyl-CoA dehydrogenase [Candidatus Bathyarchaeota archaeon]|nr:acyl-CoA dehydrogenase [Candidatus Bathyarchaeota archaeon]NIW34862.1 acyl-CoA dehydrogenase [Candidatus Bathyarchaeota archaeon]
MVFDFSETEEQKLIVNSVKEWCEKNLTAEKVRMMDDKGHPFPKEIVEGLCTLGYVMGPIPEEHGGPGIDWLTQGMIAEVIGYYDPTIATAAALMAVETGWGFTLDRYCSPTVREKYVKPAMRGKQFLGIATTEPGGGSDVSAFKSTAKKEGEEWILNGEKTFTSGTEECKEWGGGYWINVRTGPPPPEAPHRNMTSFFLPIHTEGVEVQKPYRDAGRMAISTGGFIMDDVRLPDEYRLGEEGKGFYYTMEGFDNARMMIAASCIGVTQRILDIATPYIKEREVFGRPLAKYEAIQFELAEIYLEMEALKLLTRKTTWMQNIRYQEEGIPHKTAKAKTFKPTEIAKWISLIKWKGPSLALDAAKQAMLWFGAAGYTKDHLLEAAWRGVMSYVVGAEGGKNIQKLVVARELLGKEYIPYK